MDKINETPEVTSTISTLEKLHDTVGSQQVMEDVDNAVIVKPVEAVEQKLADFVADAFKATNKDLAFNESLKSDKQQIIDICNSIGLNSDSVVIDLSYLYR